MVRVIWGDVESGSMHVFTNGSSSQLVAASCANNSLSRNPSRSLRRNWLTRGILNSLLLTLPLMYAFKSSAKPRSLDSFTTASSRVTSSQASHASTSLSNSPLRSLQRKCNVRGARCALVSSGREQFMFCSQNWLVGPCLLLSQASCVM